VDKLQALATFVRIVDRGGLTRAAESLGTSLPSVVRILATASSDWAAIREAMNVGLFTFIPLPWEPEQLPHVLRRALHLYDLQCDLLHQYEVGDLTSVDYSERLNTLRTCFGDARLRNIPLAFD